MKTLVFFLEEPSARSMLEGLLPKILPGDVVARYVVFEGKSDLENQIEKRLRGWCLPDCVFMVLRDQDSGDCKVIKKQLVLKCANAGKPEALVRIACRELESWYFGDLAAVERALDLRNISKYSGKAKYRNPDAIGNPAEELQNLTKIYQKVAGSRAIGPELNPDSNTSRSFSVFIEGVRRLVRTRV